MRQRRLCQEDVHNLLSRPFTDSDFDGDCLLYCSVAEVVWATEQVRKGSDYQARHNVCENCRSSLNHGLFENLDVADLDSGALLEGLLDCHRDGPTVLWQPALTPNLSPLQSVRLVSLRARDRWL